MSEKKFLKLYILTTNQILKRIVPVNPNHTFAGLKLLLPAHKIHSFTTEDFFVFDDELFINEILAENKYVYSVTMDFHGKYSASYETGLSILKMEIRKVLSGTSENLQKKGNQQSVDSIESTGNVEHGCGKDEESFTHKNHNISEERTKKQRTYDLPKFTQTNMKQKKEHTKYIKPKNAKIKAESFDMFK